MAKILLYVFTGAMALVMMLLVGGFIFLLYQGEITLGLKETLSLYHQETEEFLLSYEREDFNLEEFKHSSYYDDGFYNGMTSTGQVTTTSRVKHFTKGGVYMWGFISFTTKDKLRDIDAVSIMAVKVTVNSQVLTNQLTSQLANQHPYFYELGEKVKYDTGLTRKEKRIVSDVKLYFADFPIFYETPITEAMLPLEKISIELSINYYKDDKVVKEGSYIYDMDMKKTSQYIHYQYIDY